MARRRTSGPTVTDPTALVIGPDRTGRTVAIQGGRVVPLATPSARALACPAGVIAPGAVCAHTHLYSGLARHGMPPPSPPPEDFLQILRRVWWRLDRALDAASLRAAARDHVARALLAGTTSLVDHHESPSLVEGSLAILAAACDELGIRALLCYGATERNGGPEEGRRGLEECRRVPASPRLRGLVGLHASFTVSDATLRAAGALARELGTVVHVHVAEDRADVEDARRRGAEGPLERLLAHQALPPGSILAHGVHLSPAQVALASRQGCWLVQNPRSNEGNRVGYPAALRGAARVALGTDGWDADMAVEEAALFRLAAAHGDAGAAGRLEAGQRLMAERFGAAPAALAPGGLGDVVVREDGRVRHVVVDGRVVVEDGRLVAAEASAIEAEARDQAAGLWARMARIAATEG
jgi:cytosine/adenosine deaminase-related metal-dependent hydrolase